MTAKRLFLEIGSGNDLHGGDYTKAAVRAVEDAMHHSSLALFRSFGIDPNSMQVRGHHRRSATGQGGCCRAGARVSVREGHGNGGPRRTGRARRRQARANHNRERRRGGAARPCAAAFVAVTATWTQPGRSACGSNVSVSTDFRASA